MAGCSRFSAGSLRDLRGSGGFSGTNGPKGKEVRDRDAERNRDSWVQMGTSFWLSLTLSVCFLGIAKGGKGEM